MFLILLFTLEVNITLQKMVEVEVGENIILDCQVNTNFPSHMTLSWSGPILCESVSVDNETTSVHDRLVAPAKESYNGCEMFCNVSVNGTVYSAASATLIVRGNHLCHIYLELLNIIIVL